MTEVAGVSTQIQVKPDQVTPGLAAMLRRFQQLGPMLDEIGASNVTETQMRFEAEEDPEGTPWLELADITKEKKGRSGDGGTAQILRDTANLYDSLTHKVEAGNYAVTVGVTKKYGRIHQMGGQAGRGKEVTIPARPYLGVSAKGRQEIEQIMADHMTRGQP